MTEYISHILTILMGRKLQIDEDELDLYELGIEVIVSTMFTSVAIILMGVLLQHLTGAIAFLCCFITLRNYSGGYHAKTRLGCFVTSIVCYLAAEGIARLTGRLSDDVLFAVSCISVLTMLFLFYRIAPLENPNKRLMPEWKRHNRTMTFVILTFWLAVGVIGVCAGAMALTRQIWATLLVITALLWMARR